jgi:hypothetical protein
VTDKQSGAGCVWGLLAFNAVTIGCLALAFAQGPYSSWEQELWYRYGSIGFVVVGAIIPAVAMFFGARRSGTMLGITAAWLAVTFLGFCYYALMSGGGV